MNEKRNSSRNEYIDYLRGLLILLVVQGHTIQYFVYSNSSEFFSDPFFKFIYIFHMPLFMAVSGFVSFYSIDKKSGYQSISARFNQLIVPVLCLSILSKCIEYLVYASLRLSIDDLLLILPNSIVHEFLTSFWFLWCVFVSTIVVVLLRKLNIDNLLLFVISSLLIILLPEFDNLYLFKFTFPFFCAGYWFAKRGNVLNYQQITYKKIILCTLVSLICFLLWKNGTYVYISKMYLFKGNLLNIILRCIGACGFSLLFIMLSFIQFKRTNLPLISEFGKNSLSIYIIQTYIVEKFFTLHPTLQNHIILKIILSPFISIFMCLVAYYFVKFIYKYSFVSKLFLGAYSKPNIKTIVG